MYELLQIGDDMARISHLLQKIRILSKGESTDYRHEPYNDDLTLLKYLLEEKILQLGGTTDS